MDNRLPPSDREAEQYLLGCLLRDPGAHPDLLQKLRESDFYWDAHQKIFRALSSLAQAGGPCDLVSLISLLRDRSQDQDIGGPRYLAQCWDFATTSMEAGPLANLVLEHSARRQLIHALGEALQGCYERRPSADLISEVQSLLFALGTRAQESQTILLREALSSYCEDLDRRASHPEASGVHSGLLDLDNLLGGFHDGELCLIAARPSVGKTALAIQVALNHAQHAPVLLFSLEQATSEVCARILAGRSGVNSARLRSARLSSHDAHLLAQSVQELHHCSLWLNDHAPHSLLSLSSVARLWRQREGISLILVDYLQLMEGPDPKAKPHENAEALCRGLKLLARDLHLPVILLTQLNRGIEHRGKEATPKLSDLRDAGEQPADTVICLHRLQERTQQDGPAEQVNALVLKQRNGPTGEVSLMYNKPTMRFENMAHTGAQEI